MKFLRVLFCVFLVLKLHDYLERPIWLLYKTWSQKRSVKKHLNLLKKSKESFDAEILTVILLDMFKFYENSIPRPIFMERLFPGQNSPDTKELEPFELTTRQKLLPYYNIFQNLKIYGFGQITMTELLLRLEKIHL